jgi:hypothetical protein
MRPLAAVLSLAAASAAAAAPPPLPDLAALRRLEARYAPVALSADLSRLAAGERAAIGKLVEAARVMDALFLRQVWAGNEALLVELAQDRSPLGEARLAYFLRNKGPWDRLDHERPFLPGVGEKPGAGNFYPAGATREEVERAVAAFAPEAREAARGFYTVLRRAPGGGIAVVPYALEYQGELARAADLLREAAALTADPTLKRFLSARADAFLSNDYAPSDVAWMQLESAVEPTIGPYETYEDGWFSAKAAFEAFVAVRDDAETAKLARFGAELQGIEDALPIEGRWKNPKLGALAPIRVVNLVFAAGDGARGVMTAAFNLPNDEVILREHGAKRVMLRNVQEAKFAKVLAPIAKVALAPADQAKVAFDPFFTHILMHELVHGLGPHEVKEGERAGTSSRAALAETYGALEEAKADVAGLFALRKLIEDGKVDRAMERTLYPTYLASMFRSIRFGVTEAHGKGMAVQLSWFLDAGAIRAGPDGRFSVDARRMDEAVASLAREIMTIQARGDRAAGAALLARMGVVRPEVRRVLDRLGAIPVDVAPSWPVARALAPR